MQLRELLKRTRAGGVDPIYRGILFAKSPSELIDRVRKAAKLEASPSLGDLRSGIYRGQKLADGLRLYFTSRYYRAPPRLIEFSGNVAMIDIKAVQRYSDGRAMAGNMIKTIRSVLTANGYELSVGRPQSRGTREYRVIDAVLNAEGRYRTPALRVGFGSIGFRPHFYAGTAFSRTLIAHQDVAELYGLTATSYECYINGIREKFFLHFSDKLIPPKIASNEPSADVKKGQTLVDLGELLIPEWVLDKMMACGLFTYSYRFNGPPESITEAIQEARQTGYLHPNFSIGLNTAHAQELKTIADNFLGISGDGAHFASPAAGALIKSGIYGNFRDGEIIIDGSTGKIIGTILTSIGGKSKTSFANLEDMCGFKIVEAKRPVTLSIPPSRKGGTDLEKAHAVVPSINGDLLSDDQTAVKVPLWYCVYCNLDVPYSTCISCGHATVPLYICPSCKRRLGSKICGTCNIRANRKYADVLTVRQLLEFESKKLSLKPLQPLKGVKPTDYVELENLGKGLIRQYHSLMANRGGIISVRVEMQLSNGGYEGKTPVIYSERGPALGAGEIMLPIRVANTLLEASWFVDEELKRIYGLKPYYNLKSVDDLLGRLIVGLDDGLRIGVVGRIVGILQGETGLATDEWLFTINRSNPSLFVHIALLADLLINFSGSYISPEHGLTLFSKPPKSTQLTPPVEINRPRNFIKGERLDDPLYLISLQLDAINRMAPRLGDNIDIAIKGSVLLALKKLELHLSTSGLKCSVCGTPAGVSGLRNICIFCGGKLEPAYSPERLKQIVNKARMLVSYISNQATMDELDMEIEALISLIKAKKQFTLSEYN